MINLHCHSILSDGVLLPSEIAARYLHQGYRAIAITDHVDYSNIKNVISGINEFIRHWPKNAALKVLPGVELTHLPVQQFKPLAAYARRQGMKVIIAHGQTPAEPVVKGTNRAALEADIDILAHPGLITDEEVELAKKNRIFLEITARNGHRDTNRHVCECALRLGAGLVLDIDSHTPEDIITPEELKNFGLKAGLTESDVININRKVEEYFQLK